jgi:hypothetical protein
LFFKNTQSWEDVEREPFLPCPIQIKGRVWRGSVLVVD